MALTPYSPFFLSGLIAEDESSYLDLAESHSLRSYPSLKRKPSSLQSEIQPPRLRHCPSSSSSLIPSPKPEPSAALPPKPLRASSAANIPQEVRYSIASTVPSSYKRRKRTDALAALEGKTPRPNFEARSIHRNFMSMTDDEDDYDAFEGDEEAAEFYGRLVSVTAEENRPEPSHAGFKLPPSSSTPLSELDLSEDVVIPPSLLSQFASKPPAPRPVPKLTMPSPQKTRTKDTHKSFLPLSPSSTSSSSQSAQRPSIKRKSSVTSHGSNFPASVTSGQSSNFLWSSFPTTVPFLPPFTFDDIEVDFSLPPRPAPSPENYSPPLRPTRRSEDDIPITTELAVQRQAAAAMTAPLTRSHSRTRTVSTPTRSSSRRQKKGQLKSFIEFDLRSSISSKPSSHAKQPSLTSYWNWSNPSHHTASTF